MESKESESLSLQAEVAQLRKHGEYLRRRLREEQHASANAREEAARWKGRAEEEHRSWRRTHDAMNLLWQEAVAVLREHGAEPVHRELERATHESERLRRQLTRRRELTRKAVEELVGARQESRDKDAVIEQLRKRLTDVEKEREEAVQRAETVVERHDRRLRKFRKWCESWYRGQVGAIQVIAEITADLGGNPMLEPSEFERRQAIQHAEEISQADRRETAARRALVQLAERFQLDEEMISRLAAGDYHVLEELEGIDD